MVRFASLTFFPLAIFELRSSSCCRNEVGLSIVVVNALNATLEEPVERHALHTYGTLRGISDAIAMVILVVMRVLGICCDDQVSGFLIEVVVGTCIPALTLKFVEYKNLQGRSYFYHQCACPINLESLGGKPAYNVY